MMVAALTIGIVALGISYYNYKHGTKTKVCCRRKTDCNK